MTVGKVTIWELVKSMRLVESSATEYFNSLFIGVKSGNPITGGMIRYEFIEMSVRIVKLRFKEMARESEKKYNFTQATELLIKQIIKN